jgi:hypothetical protein
MRISMKHLETKAEQINKLLDKPTECYTRSEDGTYKANIGCYHIYADQCGFALHLMANENGGIHRIFVGQTKKILLGKMDAFVEGIYAKNFL